MARHTETTVAIFGDDNIQVLIERRRYLNAKITAKKAIQRDTHENEQEYRALSWAINELQRPKGGRRIWVNPK